MQKLIDLYIEDQKLAWSHTTLRSELYRLRGVQEAIDGNPLHLWELLVTRQKPYSRLTTWTRVTVFWEWLIREGTKEGSNPYRLFREKNARLFKHVYQTKSPGVSFSEVSAKIQELPSKFRSLGIQMLGTGERYSESRQETDDGGRIIGKGSKPRNTYRSRSAREVGNVSYSSFRRALQAIGLVPHDLRKLFATRLVELGATDIDLLKAMGWSSMETAKRYLQPKTDEELGKMFKEIQNAIK